MLVLLGGRPSQRNRHQVDALQFQVSFPNKSVAMWITAALISSVTRAKPMSRQTALGVEDSFYSGGEGGIRTHGTREGSTVFETA